MPKWKKMAVGDLCDTISDTYRGEDKEVVLINTSDVLEGSDKEISQEDYSSALLGITCHIIVCNIKLLYHVCVL